MCDLSSRDSHAQRRAIVVRAASEADMAAVRDIYAHYVLRSLATFEETPPTLDEMLARRRASVDLSLPYLVAEAETEILGFAYAAAYRPRPAYRFTIEDSVYVADGLGGRGIGSALLGELIAGCELGPWRRWSRSSATAPTQVRSHSIGVLVSNSRGHCDRSALSSGAGSTRRSCSARLGPRGGRRAYRLSASPGRTTPTIAELSRDEEPEPLGQRP